MAPPIFRPSCVCSRGEKLPRRSASHETGLPNQCFKRLTNTLWSLKHEWSLIA